MVFNHLIGVRFPVGPPKLMIHFVYVLISKKNSKKYTYVGYTNNLKKRLDLHNKGMGAKFTRGKHWKIMYFEKYDTKSKALSREYYIKKNRKLRNLIKEKYEKKKNSRITSF